MLEARWSRCNSFRSPLAPPSLRGLTIVCIMSEDLTATLQASMAIPLQKTVCSTSCCAWPHLYGREECLVAPSTRLTAHSGLDSLLLSKMSVRQMCPQDVSTSAKRDIFRSVLATLADDEAPGRGHNCCSVSIASTARRQTTSPCRISGQQSCGDD